MVLQGLKPRIFNRLNKFGRRWVAELPTVLWSLRTTPSQATGYTPFFKVYGSEAILPTDLDCGAPRVRAYDQLRAEVSLKDAMDQLDKAHDIALLRSAKYQQALCRYRNRQCEVGRLTLGTWCSTSSKATRTATSSLHHG